MLAASDSAFFFLLPLIVLIPLLLRLSCTVLFLVQAALAKFFSVSAAELLGEVK